ncbi:trypsin-like peptidase domain-containing protein [Alteromonas sp. 5E99-2]|nr:serine protease [Alteromonas sp. 5E99-2]MBO1256529.1 trypsin-like peptidase domain-containing protein [Alteromonas sp. 5E99-2]
MGKMGSTLLFLLSITIVALSNAVAADSNAIGVIKRVTPAVVAVGKKTPIEYRGSRIIGTGFVIGNGKYAVTNYHVVSEPLSVDVVQNYVVLSGEGRDVSEFIAKVVAIDPVHDLAILEINSNLPGLTLGEDKMLDIGTDIAFTGFPIGAILGLYPATHKGSLAAITPDAIPANNADVLTLSLLKRLKKPSLIYQLDATAYPGNSGSAVYKQSSGEVVGIINKVIVKDTKESALSSPSGISYAVPVRHIRALTEKHKLIWQ